MAYTSKLWVRKVKETRVFIEVFEATSSSPGYVEIDGVLEQRFDVGTPIVETLEDFREMTTTEQVLFRKVDKDSTK